MNWLKKIKQNEQGSATIEFLGIVPLALLVLAIVVQFVIGVNGAIMAQSAANEYASVYSVTEDQIKAETDARKIIDSTGDYLSMSNVTNNHRPGSHVREFTAEIDANIRLKFVPKKIFGYTVPEIPISTKASGRIVK